MVPAELRINSFGIEEIHWEKAVGFNKLQPLGLASVQRRNCSTWPTGSTAQVARWSAQDNGDIEE